MHRCGPVYSHDERELGQNMSQDLPVASTAQLGCPSVADSLGRAWCWFSLVLMGSSSTGVLKKE